MQINSLQSVGAVQAASRSSAVKPTASVQTVSGSSAAMDQLDLSAEAQQLLATQSTGSSEAAIRTDRVASIRQAIANGTYESPEKLSAALDKLLDSLA